MAKKSTAKQTSILQKPMGYLLSALVIYGVGYLLFFQALDSGSLLQWLGLLIAIVLGSIRLVQGVILGLKGNFKR